MPIFLTWVSNYVVGPFSDTGSVRRGTALGERVNFILDRLSLVCLWDQVEMWSTQGGYPHQKLCRNIKPVNMDLEVDLQLVISATSVHPLRGCGVRIGPRADLWGMEYVKYGQRKRNGQRREAASREAGKKKWESGVQESGEEMISRRWWSHVSSASLRSRETQMESFLWNLQKEGCLSWQ